MSNNKEKYRKIATAVAVTAMALGAASCDVNGNEPARILPPATPTLGSPTEESFNQDELDAAVATALAKQEPLVVTATPEPTAEPTIEPTEVFTATPELTPTPFPTLDSTKTVEEVEVFDGQIEADKAFEQAGWKVTFPELAFADRDDGTAFIEDIFPQVEKLQGLDKMMEFWRMFPNGFTERELRAYKTLGYNYEIVSEDGKLFLKLGDQKAEIVDHGDGEYGFPDGAEFGMHEHQFCGAGEKLDSCNFTVAPRSYTLITGEGSIPELNWESAHKENVGSALLVVNVGEVSANFGADGKTVLDNVYLQDGRYFNGDELMSMIEAIAANTVNNMLNFDTRINQEGWTNAGGNCASAFGCETVEIVVYIVSGNETLASFTYQVFK